MIDNHSKNSPRQPVEPKDAFCGVNKLHLFELIWTKAILNLRSEVHRNYLSYTWWIIEPVIHMVVYYTVFGLLLKRGGPDFPVFLLTGLVPWMWFRNTISRASNSVVLGERLMLQVGLPAISFPLIRILQIAMKQLPVFALLLIFLWIVGHKPSLQWFAIIPVIVVQALVVSAIGCGIAAIIPFFRDLSYVVTTALMFLMFISGIFYNYKNIPEEYHDLFLLNPAAYLIMCYREILLESNVPNMFVLSCWGVGSAACCVFIVWVYIKMQPTFPRVVLK